MPGCASSPGGAGWPIPCVAGTGDCLENIKCQASKLLLTMVCHQRATASISYIPSMSLIKSNFKALRDPCLLCWSFLNISTVISFQGAAKQQLRPLLARHWTIPHVATPTCATLWPSTSFIRAWSTADAFRACLQKSENYNNFWMSPSRNGWHLHRSYDSKVLIPDIFMWNRSSCISCVLSLNQGKCERSVTCISLIDLDSI